MIPPRNYGGQLEPAFQSRLASWWSGVELEDCDFYHSSTLSDGSVVRGAWDLRGREREYLGGIEVLGERVLELGPASGALTYYMEDEGADVVAFDIGFDVCGDLLPLPGSDLLEQQAAYFRMLSRVQNSWWYVHNDRKSRTRIVYGDIYSLPTDLGTFDTSIFAAILLHLRDPFRALQEAASRTTRRMVVTEALQDPSLGMDDNVMRFASANFTSQTTWWTLTPGSVRHMLRHLGFTGMRTTFSDYLHHVGHDMTKDPIQMQMFTVVAERS